MFPIRIRALELRGIFRLTAKTPGGISKSPLAETGMNAGTESALISTDSLGTRLTDPQLRILDASWYMPAEKRDVRREFEATHIPGAGFFDIDAISDSTSPYPHMLPPQEEFSKAISAMGVSHNNEIVVYDT